jgi:hypothetical protein
MDRASVAAGAQHPSIRQSCETAAAVLSKPLVGGAESDLCLGGEPRKVLSLTM